MSIVSDFDDIARRMNRKQETKPETTADESAAAVRTLKMLGYTYNDGCDLWKPSVAVASQPNAAAISSYNNALFGSLKAKTGVSSIDVLKTWRGQVTFNLPDLRGRLSNLSR